MIKLRERLERYKRVLIVAKKPSVEEFKISLKICVIGTLLIGMIGFIFYLIFGLVGV